MSATATTDQPERLRCDRDACSACYPAGGCHPGYCSDTCWAQAEADRLVNIVQGDHKYCASCFEYLRLVVPPGRAPNSTDKHKDVPECAIGFAYPMPTTIRVTGEAFALSYTADGLAVIPSGYETRRRGCECGTTHHATVERGALTVEAAIEYTKRLLDAIQMLREDGVHSLVVDRDITLDAVRHYKTDPDRQDSSDGRVFHVGIAAGLLAAHRDR